ncbi:MAG: PIG-L family deacetylase [Clostridia bacterium]|nr:PIG-L family deacetylase [Clostridia bacterium]
MPFTTKCGFIRFFSLLCTFVILFSVFGDISPVNAAEASDITSSSNVVTEGFYNPPVVLDGNYRDYTNAYNGATVTASNDSGIAYLYFIFETVPPEFTVEDTATGEKRSFSANGMIHVVLDLKKAFGYVPKAIKAVLDFHIAVSEIYLFSEGTLPSWVQTWEAPLTESDMLLLVSHSDDDQLFFAGVLPLYAGQLGMKVQVAYLTNHNDVANRRHELLDGLWHTGVRNYPIIAEFPDLYSESYDEALSVYGNAGYAKKDFTDFVSKLIQDTRPLVVVTHDTEGEYGHGTHILCTASVIEASETCTTPTGYGEIEGKWYVAKIYLHLYKDNKLTLDLDKPLSAFDGKTAFAVSQEAFRFHVSQHWTWFYDWIYGGSTPITKASEIATHNPMEYGLYSSAVGFDKECNDFFENLETISERDERLEAESKAAVEASISAEEASKAAEESARLESESIAESVAQSIADSERLDKESREKADSEAESRAAEAARDDGSDKFAAVAVLAAAMVCVCILLVIQFRKR